MGAIATAASAPPPRDPRRKCGVADWMATLDDVDRDALNELLRQAKDRDSEWNMAKVHAVCKDAGLTLRYNALSSHDGNRCACADL